MRFLLLIPCLTFIIACSSSNDRPDNNGRFPASANPPPPDKNAKIYHVMQDRMSAKGRFLVSNIVEPDHTAKDCEARAKALGKQIKGYNHFAYVATIMDPANTVHDIVIADKDEDNEPLSKSDCMEIAEEHSFKGFSCKNISSYYCGTVGNASMALVNGDGKFSPVEAALADKTIRMTAK